MMAPVPSGSLPASLAANPRLGDWVSIRPTGIVEIRSGKVELGQGVLTALAQIAAEELDVDFACVRMIPTTTGLSPNEGYTAGSHSIQESGAANHRDPVPHRRTAGRARPRAARTSSRDWNWASSSVRF